MADSDQDEERLRRKKPQGSGPPAGKRPSLLAPKGKPAWLAPNSGDKNTIHFTTWVEVKVVTRHGVPLKNERVRCYSGDGSVLELKTDKGGLVRFTDLPIFDFKSTVDDLKRPAISLPDVLEEWNENPPGDFEKQDPWRKHDRKVRFVPVETAAFLIEINELTEEQKFRHFMRQYLDHGAKYWSKGAIQNDYKSALLRWQWSNGAVCNQHTNFFLGYWLNYNHVFTRVASRTTTMAQLGYDSSIQSFPSPPDMVRHRGYLEFLEPLDTFGKDNADFGAAGATHPDTPPSTKSDTAYRTAKQVRLSRFFDPDTFLPTDDRGQELFAALGNFNVYAVSDVQGAANRAQARNEARKWLKAHLERAEHFIPELANYPATAPPAVPASPAAKGKAKPKPKVLTKADVIDKRVTNALADRIIWQLEDEDETDLVLIRKLRNLVNWDHHAGVMLKRESDAGDAPTGQGDELFTFSADGSLGAQPGPAIRLKRLSTTVGKTPFDTAATLKGSFFMHLVICRILPLQPGGYAADVNDPDHLPDFLDVSKEPEEERVTSLHVARFIEWK